MRNKFRKAIKCELRQFFSSNILSSARNAQSESDKHFSPTSFEQRWDMKGEQHSPFLLTYSITVHTVLYHSYCVEASNPLTPFADFRFKDRFFEENSMAQFTF